MALSIDQMNAVTSEYFAKVKMEQQVYEQTVVLNQLLKRNRIISRGGTLLEYPIRYKKLGDAQMVDWDAERLSVQYSTRTAIQLNWRPSKVDVVMLWDELTKNRGDAQIVDLMKDKIEEGLQDLSELISTQFHQAYASKGALDMDGFFTTVQSTDSDTTYGSVSSGDAPSWIAGLYDASTTTLSLYGSGSLEAGRRACAFIDYPDLYVTTRALAGLYSSKLQPGERRRPEEGRAGATDLYFMGVPVLEDPQTNSNTWMFLNTNHMYFILQEGEAFKSDPWEKDPDKIRSVRKLTTVVGNFLFTIRKQFGAYTAITS